MPATKSGTTTGFGPELHRVVAHPVRARVLEILCEQTSTPKDLAETLGVTVGNVSYHVRVLSGGDWLELVRTEPRRGTVAHFYRATPKARQGLAALNKRGWRALAQVALDEMKGQSGANGRN